MTIGVRVRNFVVKLLEKGSFLYRMPPMPKQKSHSGAKKRVRRTGSGNVAVKRNSKNHLLQQKSSRQKSLSRTLVTAKGDTKKLVKLLPYL